MPGQQVRVCIYVCVCVCTFGKKRMCVATASLHNAWIAGVCMYACVCCEFTNTNTIVGSQKVCTAGMYAYMYVCMYVLCIDQATNKQLVAERLQNARTFGI